VIHAYLTAIAALTVESPAPVPVSSATDQLVTVAAAGIASIVVAAIGAFGLRRRRQNEVDAIPLPLQPDPGDRMSVIRERIRALETRADRADRDMDDVKEQLQLHRAVDVVTEASVAPRRRRRDSTG
jgi:hypothetical protein